MDLVKSDAIKNASVSAICCWCCVTSLNFIKNEALAQLFSWEFCEFFQSATLLKTRLHHMCFLVNFAKIFKRTCFEDHLRTAASNEWLLLDYFIIYIAHQNKKQKDIKDILFVKMFLHVFNILLSLKTTIISLLYQHAQIQTPIFPTKRWFLKIVKTS